MASTPEKPRNDPPGPTYCNLVCNFDTSKPNTPTIGKVKVKTITRNIATGNATVMLANGVPIPVNRTSDPTPGEGSLENPFKDFLTHDDKAALEKFNLLIEGFKHDKNESGTSNALEAQKQLQTAFERFVNSENFLVAIEPIINNATKIYNNFIRSEPKKLVPAILFHTFPEDEKKTKEEETINKQEPKSPKSHDSGGKKKPSPLDRFKNFFH